MDHEHPNPNPHDDPSAGPLFYVTIISTILFVATVFAIAALYFQVEIGETNRQQYQTAIGTAESNRANQEVILNTGPLWTDKAAGTVQVPIETAKQVVARELAGGGTGLPPATGG